MLLNFVALALAMITSSSPTVPAKTQDQQAVMADIDAIYAPYFAVGTDAAADDKREKHFSPGLASLMKRWRDATKEAELTNMSSYDWFCQCQDWDNRTGSYRIEQLIDTAPGTIEAKVRFIHGFDEDGKPSEGAVLTLMYRKGKNGRWGIADMVFEENIRLTTELEREIRTKGME